MKKQIHLLLTSMVLPILPGVLPASSLVKIIEAQTQLKATAFATPQFPLRMSTSGVTQGESEVIVEIASDGSIRDFFVVASSHQAFAKCTAEAIQSWAFTPTSATTPSTIYTLRLNLRFRAERMLVVVTQPHPTQWELERFKIAPCAATQLDAPLSLESSRPPRLPVLETGEAARGSVLVSYYIDQEGRVRVPTVNPGESPELAAAAAEALRDWRFQPPTANGKPVFVHVKQRFKFGQS